MERKSRFADFFEQQSRRGEENAPQTSKNKDSDKKEVEKEKEPVKPEAPLVAAPSPAVNIWAQRKEAAAKAKPAAQVPTKAAPTTSSQGVDVLNSRGAFSPTAAKFNPKAAGFNPKAAGFNPKAAGFVPTLSGEPQQELEAVRRLQQPPPPEQFHQLFPMQGMPYMNTMINTVNTPTPQFNGYGTYGGSFVPRPVDTRHLGQNMANMNLNSGTPIWALESFMAPHGFSGVATSATPTRPLDHDADDFEIEIDPEITIPEAFIKRGYVLQPRSVQTTHQNEQLQMTQRPGFARQPLARGPRNQEQNPSRRPQQSYQAEPNVFEGIEDLRRGRGLAGTVPMSAMRAPQGMMAPYARHPYDQGPMEDFDPRPSIPAKVVEERLRAHPNAKQHQGVGFMPMLRIRDPNSDHSLAVKIQGKGRQIGPRVDPSVNCCLHLEGLHPETTYQDLLSALRGKILRTHIIGPNDRYPTAAAKVGFCTRAQAMRTFHHIQYEDCQIRGQKVQKVKWNWDGYAEDECQHQNQSRILMIEGPAEHMSSDAFENLWKSKIHYDLEGQYQVPCNDETRIRYQFRFGSIPSQSEAAKQILDREPNFPRDIFRVWFADDPCEENY